MSSLLRKYGSLLIAFTIALLIAMSSGLVIAQDAQPSNTVLEPAPVILDGEILFYLQTEVASFSPAERAKAANIRLQAVAQDRSIQLEDIQLETGEGITKISVDGIRIIGIRDADAQAAAINRNDLATEYLKRVKAEIQAYRERYSQRRKILGGVYASLIALAIYIFLRRFPIFSKYIFPRLRSWLEHHKERNKETGSDNLWDELADVLLLIVQVIRFLLFGGLCYIYFVIVLTFFPNTEGIAITLRQELLTQVYETGESLIVYLPNLLRISITLLISKFILRFTSLAFNSIERELWFLPGFHKEWSKPTYTLSRFIIVLVTAAVVIPYLPGYGSAAFHGISLFAGLVVSLGSTGTVNNVISGMVLIYTRSFQVGDRVKIDNSVGLVLEQSLLVTRIKTIKNIQITIPNSTILSKDIINYSALARDANLPLIISIPVTLGYDVPWQQVEKALLSAAEATEDYVLKEPKPFVWQTSLQDFYVSYELNAYLDNPQNAEPAKAAINQNIQDHCNKNGIEILSPHYAALRDGNPSTIPPEYFPPD